MIDLEAGIGGNDALRAQLESLKKKASQEALKRALFAGGHVLKSAIQERMPVRNAGGSTTALSPGELKADIHIKLKHADARSVSVLVGPGKRTVLIAYDLEFGHFVAASGGLKVIRRKGSKPKFVPAHPVFRPAWEASQDEALRAVIDSLRESGSGQ